MVDSIVTIPDLLGSPRLGEPQSFTLCLKISQLCLLLLPKPECNVKVKRDFRLFRVSTLTSFGVHFYSSFMQKSDERGGWEKGKGRGKVKEAETGEERRSGVQSPNMEDGYQCFRIKATCTTQHI